MSRAERKKKRQAAVNPGALREIERGAAYRPVFPARVVYLRHTLIFQASTVSAPGLRVARGQSLSIGCVAQDNLFLESRMNAAHIQPTLRVRCRVCQGEAIYVPGHIVDFSQASGEPPSWVRHLDRIADSGSRSE